MRTSLALHLVLVSRSGDACDDSRQTAEFNGDASPLGRMHGEAWQTDPSAI